MIGAIPKALLRRLLPEAVRRRLVNRALPEPAQSLLGRRRALRMLADFHQRSPSARHLHDLRRLYLAGVAAHRNAVTELRARYPGVASAPPSQQRAFREREYKLHSQCGEDGILLHIFSQIGADSRVALEFGAGGYSSNIVNLVANFGWHGIFMDANKDNLTLFESWNLKDYQGIINGTYQLAEAWITAENINSIIADVLCGRSLDLLSIDIDGNDYWVWKAFDVQKPRVVVIEYNAIMGDERRLTTPYAPDFSRNLFHPSGKIFGASLPALEALGRQKGYRLVCCDSWGVNAFFVRDDLAEGHFEPSTAQDAFYDHFQWAADYQYLRPELSKVSLIEI